MDVAREVILKLLYIVPPLVFVAIGLTIFVNKDDGYGVYDHDQGVLLL